MGKMLLCLVALVDSGRGIAPLPECMPTLYSAVL